VNSVRITELNFERNWKILNICT